jgi:iron complex transport system permease protein
MAGAALVAVMLASTWIGPAHLSPGQVVHGFLNPASLDGVILWQVRLPRVAAGAEVGMALAAAGTVFQGVFQNPLTDPYVLGSASGAAFGAALGLVLAPSAFWVLPFGGFAGALGAVALAMALGSRLGGGGLARLLLVGYALSVLLGAALSLLLLFDQQAFETILFWEMGSLASATWSSVLRALPMLVVGLALPMLLRYDMNALPLGDEEARSVGIDLLRLRRVLLACAALLTAAAVSTAGIIGFVGLVAPHAVRRLVGESHARLLPAATLAGGTFLVAADTVARSLPAVGEVPIGVVTALLGGPLFLYLLSRHLAAGEAAP